MSRPAGMFSAPCVVCDEASDAWEGIDMFFVENEKGIVGNFFFSAYADAERLAQALGGEVVPAVVNPMLSYEDSMEKTFQIIFSGEVISSVEVIPMILDERVVRRQVLEGGQNDWLSSDGHEARIYICASSEAEARTLASERRAIMAAEAAAREGERVAGLAGCLSATTRGEVATLLAEGRKASAVKFVRGALTCGLREAVRVVDYLDDQRQSAAADSH